MGVDHIYVLLDTTIKRMGQSSSKGPQHVEENKDSASHMAEQASTDSTTSAPNRRRPDKLRDGPCGSVFSDLEKCASAKGVSEHAVSWAFIVGELTSKLRVLNV